MTSKTKRQTECKEGRGYTREQWDAVSDNPEWTDEELAKAKPFAEVFPELAEKMRKNVGGRPRLEAPKRPVSIRLDDEEINRFKAGGPGWQSRINETLRKAVGLK